MADTHRDMLARQLAFGTGAFGPGERSKGVVDHCRKELVEIEECKTADDRAAEWCDMVILSQDGLLRAVREALREQFAAHKAQAACVDQRTGKVIARYGEPTNDYVAEAAQSILLSKRDKNELRDWGNWREKSEDEAIQHTRGIHD